MLEKTFDPKSIEQDAYKAWEDAGVFACAPQSNKAPHTIMMPPPNVTGSLHMGHALTMTLQDILTRFYRMRGQDALWMPGTDHAGIATQMVVERKLEEEEGKKRKDFTRDEFIEKVWEWKEHSGSTIQNQLRRLGTTPDWARERFTMDDGLSDAVLKVFVQLHKEGLIYKDKRLVNWHPTLHTAVSDLEVTQKETKSKMWHINYPLEGEVERHITVATTRPETMFGDTAIAVHPDDARYRDLIGKFAVLPIVGRLLPIVADEYADPEQGSGAVKITPAHDFNDFEVGKRHDLEMINIFDKSAAINENGPEAYRGMDRYAARKKVLAELEEMDLIAKVDDHIYMLPYDEKSKTVVIEPLLTDQWYCDAATMAKPALEAVRSGKTEFVPKSWENTYFDWLENIQPWCISRQLWWGHQIPAWYGPNGEVYVAESEEEALAQAREKHDMDVPLTRDPDVLDTWFSSALWPFSTLGWPEKTPELDKYYPGEVLITGFDIIFFWVARMMMMGIHFMGEVPFHKVYIHALVRDEKGQKMSKSKGNVIDPLDVIEKYGTDALRFTLTAMAAQGRDIKMSEQRVEGYRNFATKIWNAARYCQMNDCKMVGELDVASLKHAPNKWIISELNTANDKICKALEAYKYNDAAQVLYQFVWGTFCDWYLELTKGNQSAEMQATTGFILHEILHLMNPFMPYISEEIFNNMNDSRDKSLLLTRSWPEPNENIQDGKQANDDMDWLMRMISEIRSVRADMNVPAAAKIDLVVVDANDKTQQRLTAYGDVLMRMARLKDVAQGKAPKGSIQSVLDEATIALPIANIIDLDKERARLRREIEKLNGDISRIDNQLANKQFVKNAPQEVVDEQKQRKIDALSVKEKLSRALEQLEAA